jgi:hypothetical protein
LLSSEVLSASNEEDGIVGEGEKIANIQKSLDDANVEVNLFKAELVETEKQKMLEVVLPCSVEQFYNFFLSDDATVYSRKKHLEFKKGENVVMTPWKKN